MFLCAPLKNNGDRPTTDPYRMIVLHVILQISNDTISHNYSEQEELSGWPESASAFVARPF